MLPNSADGNAEMRRRRWKDISWKGISQLLSGMHSHLASSVYRCTWSHYSDDVDSPLTPCETKVYLWVVAHTNVSVRINGSD